MKDKFDCIVIGAGPAGLFCALHAAMPGQRILLLEKNPDPGAHGAPGHVRGVREEVGLSRAAEDAQGAIGTLAML